MRPNCFGGCPGVSVVEPPPSDDVKRDKPKGEGIMQAFIRCAMLVAALALLAATPVSAQTCPNLSQASLDLDTLDCPTTYDAIKAEERTSWTLSKTALSAPLTLDVSTNPSGLYSFEVKVAEGPTTLFLVSTGQIIITNSGQLSPYLESVVVNLQTKSSGTKFMTVASAVAVRAGACKDGETVNNPEGALTCLGDFMNSSGASLLLTDLVGNDVTALMTVQIPPSGMVPCDDAVRINFHADFDLTSLSIVPGDSVRIEVLVTFGGAGPRGKSPESVSCTKDTNCSGVIDADNPATCNVNESETNNIRTVRQRSSQEVPPATPVCPSVTVADSGTASNDTDCVSATDSTNNANAGINATGAAGTMTAFSVGGTAMCVDAECNTSVSDMATLTCVDGTNGLITGSPASASIDVTCEGETQPPEPPGVGDFCTRTQGCWGQPGGGMAPCRSLLTASTGGFSGGTSPVFPSGLFIGEAVTCALNSCGKTGILDVDEGGTESPVTFAAKWTTADAIRDYLPAGGTSGTLSADLTNPMTTSSGVFDGQLVAAELNVAFNDAGASLVTGSNTATKLGDLVYQACSAFTIATAIQGKTVRQVIDAANRVASGEFGTCATLPSPCQSQSLTIPGFGTVTIGELETALDALNNNFDNCTAALGCLTFPPTP